MKKTCNQITIGEFIKKLKSVNPSFKIQFAPNIYPREISSYRGFYEDVAISMSCYPVTVEEFLKKLKNSIGETQYGYKGGEYETTKDTAIWVANYSETGAAITGIEVTDVVTILTEAYE